MVYPTNQNRQMYVMTKYQSNPSAKGDLAVKSANGQMYFLFKGADTILRSDLIDLDKISYAKVTDIKKMRHELKSVKVSLNGDLVAGQEYILNIKFRQAFGMGDQHVYIKNAGVRATSSMTKDAFYLELATALAKNFSKELQPLVTISLIENDGKNQDDSESTVAVGPKGAATTLAEGSHYTGIVFDEVEQPWVLGTTPKKEVFFTVITVPITVDGDEVAWGTVESLESSKYWGNGTEIADMEYFYMGERGDQYRMMGYPNVIPTEYLVKPTEEYYTVDIHYSFVDSNESVQKSEKDILIVCSTKAQVNSLVTAVNAIKANLLNSLT